MLNNTELYALLNPDLRRAGLRTPEQLQQHYQKRGKREKRPITFRQKFPFFNHQQYQENYPDLAGMTKEELELHYLKSGFRQQRTYLKLEYSSNSNNVPENKSHIHIFTQIYETEKWGKSEFDDFKGSPGEISRLDYTLGFAGFLRKFIETNNIKSIVDIGCGNFDWARPTYENLEVSYLGIEAYEKLVIHNQTHHPEFKFVHMDAFHKKEKLESADMCILKDVLEHWSNEEITIFLDYLYKSKKYKYILVVNCNRDKMATENKDIQTGDFRDLNINFPPLNKYKIKLLYDFSIKEVCMIFI